LRPAGQTVWRGRGGGAGLALTRDDLVESGADPLVGRSRAQETDLPAAIEIGFTDGEAEYPRAAVGSRRLSGSSRRELSADVALVTRRAEAQRLADIQRPDLWAARETLSFALSPRQVAVEPGDVLSIALDGRTRLVRVTQIADGPSRLVSAQAVEPAIFRATPVRAVPSRPRSTRIVPGPPEAILLTLAAAPSDPAPLQYLAVAAEPWPGAIAVWRSADGAGFTLLDVVDLPAVIGRTLSPLSAGPLWRWDRVARLEIELSAASLASIDDAAALAGGNLFALEGPDGIWEILTAARAELIGPRRYRLSRFLRGLGGHEGAAGRSVPAGARIVRVDASVLPLTDGLGDLGRAPMYRIGPAGRDHADPTYLELTATVAGDALRPLSPVLIKARRTGEGIAITWIRRTRRDGGNWDLVDVPLGEESERYEVDVLAGATVLRTLMSSTPTVLYPAADELADFGAPQAALSLRVVQLSASVGRGFPAGAEVPIRPA
jgi:hypothetical protein